MSGKYLAARDAFGEGSLSWTQDRIVAQLMSDAYQFDEADSALTGTVGDPVALTGASFQDGWARADKLTFRKVKGAAAVVAIVFRRDDGLLIMYADSIQSFPMTPNGGDIEVEILEPGIFRL